MPSVAIRNAAIIVLLGAAAAFWNLHAPTIFFDSQIMLGGSIAVFALLHFGWPGLAVGVFALAATALRWGHPFELIIGTTFLVWLLIFLGRFNGGWGNRDNGRVVLAALAFWLVAGIALETLLFNRVFDLPVPKALGIGLKEAVTAMVNTSLGLLAFLAMRVWGERGGRSTLSGRGLVFASILAAITIPGIGLSMTLSGQLKESVLRGYRDNLSHFATVAAADAARGMPPRNEVADPYHKGMAFLARRDDGTAMSSDPALFERLERDFEIETPARTELPGLDILRPKHDAPVIIADDQSYWVTEFTMPDPEAENRSLRVTATQSTAPMIRTIDYELLLPSFTLLFTIMAVAALASDFLGGMADRQFQSVIGPLQAHAPDQPMADLKPATIRELDAIVAAVNERSHMLAESERKYRNFFNLPLVGAAITSRTKGWVAVNDATCELLGYSREELVQKTWADITHPDDLGADEGQFARMLRREIDGYQLEKRFIRKDGTVVHTLLAGGCGPIGDTTPDLFYVNILDITERKEAEQKLHDALMNMPLPVACGSNDEPPAITLVNKAFTETFGYTREDIPTVQDWLEAAYPDPAYRAEILAGWEAGIARGRREEAAVGVAEVRIRCKDGSVRDAIFSATLTRDGPIVTFQDISNRKQLEADLRLSEERHRLLADNAVDVINLIDLDGRLLYTSPSVEKLLGYTPEERLTLSVEDVLLPEGAAIARAGLAQTAAAVAAGERPLPEFQGEFPHRRKDGSIVWAEATITSMLDKDGKYVATLGVTRDISKRKQLEDELAAAREREKQTEREMRATLEKKLKSSLNAAAVAHEITQPLSRILLRARLDLEKQSGADRETLEALVKDANCLVDTIEKMKALLRNVETVQQPVDVEQIVSGSLLQLTLPLRLNTITVRSSGPEERCTVLGDEVQLGMALTNVIRNAIEAIAQSGSEHREITIECIPRDGTVAIVVGDSGPGWPGGTIDDMLLNTSKPGGSGVGLYVVKTAVENHRGEIHIARSPLGGAEFRITLPTIANPGARANTASG